MEHEIYPVTMGHRITLTYNIYFQEGKTNIMEPPSDDLNKHPFCITLSRLINEDSTFLPFGGVIIFYLTHEYPNFRSEGCGQLPKTLIGFLKGNDRALCQIAKALNLFPEAKALIDIDRYSSNSTVLSNTTGLSDFSECYGETLDEALRKLLYPEQGDFQEGAESPGGRKWSDCMLFLNQDSKAGTQWKESYIAYGNEASIGYMYGKAILAMYVQPWGKDGRIESDNVVLKGWERP